MSNKLFQFVKKICIIFIILFTVSCSIPNSMIFYPEKLNDNFKYHFPGPFTEFNIKTQKDAVINALLFRAKSSKGVVLYFHGNAGNLNTWGFVAETFTKKGYDVFIFDYRTFGKSKGVLNEKSLHSDAEYLYSFVLKKYKANKIIIYGRSIGTGVAARLASKFESKLLILETPYTNFAELTKYHAPYVPVTMLNYKLTTDTWIKKSKAPVHLFHGTNDKTIPYSMSVKLTEILNNDKILTTIKRGSHNNLSSFPVYHKKLKELLAD